MITQRVAKHVSKNNHGKLIALAVGAAGVLLVVGVIFDHHKCMEYGTLWLFEQCIGGVKAHFTGGSE